METVPGLIMMESTRSPVVSVMLQIIVEFYQAPYCPGNNGPDVPD